MAKLGTDTKPAFSFHAFGGSGQTNQEAEALVLPAQRIRILTLGAWIGGWSSACKVALCLWANDGTILAQSDEFTVANEGTPGDGKASKYTADLLVPYETATPGLTVKVGFTRDRDDAHIVLTGSTSNPHIHARGFYPPGGPAGDLGGATAESSATRRIGMWIENYEPMANAYVLRSGVWVRNTPKGLRSGVWTEADAVKGHRTGSWVDAD